MPAYQLVVSLPWYPLHKDLEEIVEYIVKITTNPQITNARIEKEKKAVREELERELNDPYWEITNKLTKYNRH